MPHKDKNLYTRFISLYYKGVDPISIQAQLGITSAIYSIFKSKLKKKIKSLKEKNKIYYKLDDYCESVQNNR